MFSFIPQIIILVAIVIIIVIIIKKFPEASKYSQKELDKGNKEETIGARILSVLKYIGKRLRIFSVSIVKGIFSGIKKARKEKTKINKKDENDLLSGLVKDKLDLNQGKTVKEKTENEPSDEIKKESEEEKKVIDLLEEAAEKLGSGNYKEAESNYIEVVKVDSKNIRAYKGLGRLYAKQYNKKDAIASYEQVLKIDPNDSEAIEELDKLNFLKG